MTLNIEHLSKAYGGKVALTDVNLALRDDTIYGLFGRNGAGKSTLLGCVANRLTSTGGAITLDGTDVRGNEDAQNRIYLLNETMPVLAVRSAMSLLREEEQWYGPLDWDLALRMLQAFGIEPGSAYGHLSLGQRMAVRLAAAFSAPADVLLLDEPMLGLDAVNRALFHRFLLESFASRPRTIVVSTHGIDEIAPVVERVVVLDQGRVIDEFEADAVASQATELTGEPSVVGTFVEAERLGMLACEHLGGLDRVTVRGAVAREALPAGVTAASLGLQDYVVKLTDPANRVADDGEGK